MKIAGSDEDFNLSQELNQVRKELSAVDKMRMNFDNSSLHKGKIQVTAKEVNVSYGSDEYFLNEIHAERSIVLM